MASLLSTSAEDIALAAQRLNDGRLVSFPTETVYGLGANALNEEAAKRIFEVKGRPPTDPLICHVPSIDEAPQLWDVDEETLAMATKIGKALWPGPVTIVAKAAASIPNAVTGGSGFVGVRVPDHPVALSLLQAAKVPVAAPSANTFGHVSPTTAQHVLADLALRDPTLSVVDGGSCTIGIESTVLKVLEGRVEFLRRGKVSLADVQKALGPSVPLTVRDTRTRHKKVDEAMDGPGQLLTHYSPCVPSYLLAPSSLPSAGTSLDKWVVEAPSGAVPCSEAIVLDFGGCLSALQGSCLQYRNLSPDADPLEACQAVFDSLRWTETIDGASIVVFPMASEWGRREGDELIDAVEDRLFRAASGTVVAIKAVSS